MALAEVELHQFDDSLFLATLNGIEVCRVSVAAGAGVWELYSTVTRPEYEGRGYAARLVRHALDCAASAGVQVVPSCWFVDAMMDRWSPEYDHLSAGASAPTGTESCRIAPAVVRPGFTGGPSRQGQIRMGRARGR